MDYSTALMLEKEWGDKPCAHEKLSRHKQAGMDFGDYHCMQCGKNFDSREEADEHAEKQRQKGLL